MVALTIEASPRRCCLRLEGRRRPGQGASGAPRRVRILPHSRGSRRPVIKRTFEPGSESSGTRRSELALSSARQLGMALPGTAIAQTALQRLRRPGRSAWDHSAMVGRSSARHTTPFHPSLTERSGEVWPPAGAGRTGVARTLPDRFALRFTMRDRATRSPSGACGGIAWKYPYANANPWSLAPVGRMLRNFPASHAVVAVAMQRA